MFTHKIGQTYQDASGTMASVVATYQADGEVNLDDTVAAGASNKEFDIAITVAKLKSVGIYSDQAVTIKTNNTSSPQETILLGAKQLIAWAYDHTETIPFAGNITKLYISNAGTAIANVKVRALVDESV